MRHMLIAALLALATGALSTGHSAAAAKGPLKVGEIAPDFTLTLVNGETVALSDLRGQVVVLNFWATWCAPCKKELPILDSYYQVLRDKGLRVYAVTTEGSVPISRLRKLFAAMAIPAVRRVKGPYQVLSGVPTNYVIGSDGRVRYAAAGAFELDTLNAIIIPLMNERAPAAATPTSVRP